MRDITQLPANTLTTPESQRTLQERLQLLGKQTGPSSVTQDYIFKDNDTIDSLQVDATSGNITITLPSPTGNRRRRVIKTDSSTNTVTIAGTINGVTNYTLNKQYEQLTIEPTQIAWLIIGTGTLTPSFNSISFPATQVASSDPNTLDDYEEGTWTPSLGGNATYNSRTGTYTKIGRLVTGQFRLDVLVLGTGSTSVISGLPFTVGTDNIYTGNISYWASLAGTYVHVGFVISTTVLTITGATAATATTTLPAAVLGNGATIIGNFSYTT
jgi:hypothetical protein